MNKKTDYVKDDPEQFLVNAENSKRRDVLEVFKRRRDDFESQKDYDKHLEMIEDMIFVLSDLESTDEQKE